MSETERAAWDVFDAAILADAAQEMERQRKALAEIAEYERAAQYMKSHELAYALMVEIPWIAQTALEPVWEPSPEQDAILASVFASQGNDFPF